MRRDKQKVGVSRVSSLFKKSIMLPHGRYRYISAASCLSPFIKLSVLNRATAYNN